MRGEELNQMKKASQKQYWWDSPTEELSLPRLQQLKSALEELQKNVAKQAAKILIQNANPQQQLFVGSSSARVLPNYETNNRDMAFGENMMAQGYNIAPNMVPPGYNLDPEGFNPNPQGYNLSRPGFGRRFF